MPMLEVKGARIDSFYLLYEGISGETHYCIIDLSFIQPRGASLMSSRAGMFVIILDTGSSTCCLFLKIHVDLTENGGGPRIGRLKPVRLSCSPDADLRLAVTERLFSSICFSSRLLIAEISPGLPAAIQA